MQPIIDLEIDYFADRNIAFQNGCFEWTHPSHAILQYVIMNVRVVAPAAP